MLIDKVVQSRAILQQIISYVGPALSHVCGSRHGLDQITRGILEAVRSGE